MFQEFYKDTLASRFIKSLLSQTPIPIYKCVFDGDQLIAGNFYIYRNLVIQCETSGTLAVSETEHLYPSNTLYPSEFLFVGLGVRAATFYVRANLAIDNNKILQTYQSTTNYYDPETHYFLGNYLRYLKCTTELDLMPYYNCFNGASMSTGELSFDGHHIYLDKSKYSKEYKVLSVPILFGRNYKIYLDSTSSVLLRAALINDDVILDEKKIDASFNVEGLTHTQDVLPMQTLLNTSGKFFTRSSFKHPLEFCIENNNILCSKYEKYLHLLIQIPISNNSSIVVLENVETDTGVTADKNSVRKPYVLNPSLLYMNTHCSYAFSNRLIEYLLGRVICKQDIISKNIEKIQSALRSLSSDYDRAFIANKRVSGVYDSDINKYIFNIVKDYSESNLIYDQDGNVNVDVERILVNKGARY